jgi:hypothetical protein
VARTHTYVCAKGYADKYQGREVKWTVLEDVATAISSGDFPDEKTLVRYAYAQLNIRKGHAIMDATKETKKDAEGKDTGELVNPDLSLAEMEKIAATTVASANERTRTGGAGGQKVAAQKFTSAKEKIAAKLATATEEQLAEWLDLDLITEEQANARRAELGGNRKRNR